MGFRAALGGLAIACAAACACNALTGIGDLAVGPEAGVAIADASSDAPIPTTPPPPVDAGIVDAAVVVDTGPPPLCPSAGNSCVPVAPAGWDGPFQIYSGDSSSVPACPAALPRNDDENVGNPQGSINCADCRCGAPLNQKCSITNSVFSDTACTPPAVTTDDPTACLAGDTTDPAFPYGATVATVVSGGFCGVQAPATQVPSAITWPTVARLCSRDDDFLANGCADGSLCVPDGVQPYLTHTCIRQLHNDADCPAPWTQKTTSFNNVADNRACTQQGCTCDNPPTGSTCSATLHVFTAADCTGGFISIKVPTTACTGAMSTESAKIAQNSIAIAGGGCNPEGQPTATGGVAGGDDVNTICCVP